MSYYSFAGVLSGVSPNEPAISMDPEHVDLPKMLQGEARLHLNGGFDGPYIGTILSAKLDVIDGMRAYRLNIGGIEGVIHHKSDNPEKVVDGDLEGFAGPDNEVHVVGWVGLCEHGQCSIRLLIDAVKRPTALTGREASFI